MTYMDIVNAMLEEKNTVHFSVNDDYDIVCETEQAADTVADFIEAIIGGKIITSELDGKWLVYSD